MRVRVAAACALAVAAIGSWAATASAAKPVLWLASGISYERSAPGSSALIGLDVEGCLATQSGTLETNGKTTDKVTVQPTGYETGCPSA